MIEIDTIHEELGFKESPFSITPDTSLFFPTEDQVAALSHMQFGLQSGGFTLVTGEVGLGKTLLCRMLLQSCPENIHTAYIFNPMQSTEDLLKSILLDLTGAVSESSTAAELHDEIYQVLINIANDGGRAAVIIDEAHCLPPKILESLRLISNLETEKQKLISFILVGQPEIKNILKLEELRALSQRFCVRYNLKTFSYRTTSAYIKSRISDCHKNSNFQFSETACFWIHQYSKGIPRRINQICDRAIMAAYSRSRTYINANIALKAAKEIIQS